MEVMTFKIQYEKVEFKMEWTLHTKNGTSRYAITNGRYHVIFDSQAELGKNYFNIVWVYDTETNRKYTSPRYHIKFIPIVREFSGKMFLQNQKEMII